MRCWKSWLNLLEYFPARHFSQWKIIFVSVGDRKWISRFCRRQNHFRHPAMMKFPLSLLVLEWFGIGPLEDISFLCGSTRKSFRLLPFNVSWRRRSQGIEGKSIWKQTRIMEKTKILIAVDIKDEEIWIFSYFKTVVKEAACRWGHAVWFQMVCQHVQEAAWIEIFSFLTFSRTTRWDETFKASPKEN